MTEKRFTHTDNGFIIDKSEKKVLNLYDVVDVLNELNDENKKLRKIITEMKDIIYTLEEVYVIGEYSSEIEKDVQELKKAYDGNLEDFLNYFKED